MDQARREPFPVTRIPGLNGEWMDIHVSESKNLCVDTSGYVELSPETLWQVLRSVGAMPVN